MATDFSPNASLDPVAKGYGVISTGSSMSTFLGANQSIFLGGKQSTTVGAQNTFTAGLKTDFFMGAAVNMSFAPLKWDKDKGDAGKILHSGNFFAKYDFSNNKTFAFHIAEEGSSTYVTQSKFMCTKGFLAVGGFQEPGALAYKAYTEMIEFYGYLTMAMDIFLGSLTLTESMLWDTSDKKVLTPSQQNLAMALPIATNFLGAIAISAYAMRVAIERESVFKHKIHPQSVFALEQNRVFLGQTSPTPAIGSASLLLNAGRATLSSRDVLPTNLAPYTPKTFNDFNDQPTSALEVEPWRVQTYASQMISINAGNKDISAARIAELTQLKAATLAGETAFQLALARQAVDPVADPEASRQDAYNSTFAAQAPLVAAAQEADQATAAAGGGAAPMIGASIHLRANGKIESTALINFDVTAPDISLATDVLSSRGFFAKTVPVPTISIQQSPICEISLNELNEIKLESAASSAIIGPTAASLMCTGASVVELQPTGISIKGLQIKLSGPFVQIGNSLKVLG